MGSLGGFVLEKFRQRFLFYILNFIEIKPPRIKRDAFLYLSYEFGELFLIPLNIFRIFENHFLLGKIFFFIDLRRKSLLIDINLIDGKTFFPLKFGLVHYQISLVRFFEVYYQRGFFLLFSLLLRFLILHDYINY